MKREWFKTLLLVGLVATSVLFTWQLWTYKTNYETYAKSPTPRNVSIADSMKLDEVVRPYLFIYNHKNTYLGTNHREDVDALYHFIKSAPMDHITIPPVRGRYIIPNRGNNPDYEIIFPAPLTKQTLLKLFSFSSKRASLIEDNVEVDRVKLYKTDDQTGNIIAIFSKGNTIKFYTMVDESSVFSEITSYTNELEKNKALSAYFKPDQMKETDQLKADGLYLPLHQVQVRKLSYVYVKEDAFKFVEAYFNDPENALHSNGIYSDGVHQLKEKGQVILYLNPSKDNVVNDIDPILQSFTFVNGHSGWTDDYLYMGYSIDAKMSTSDVMFRMQKNDYPVFSTGYYPFDYASEIDLKWERGYLHQIGRTLLNLNNYEFPGAMQTLKSGREVLEELSNNNKIKLSTIDDLKIGYALNPMDTSATINLVPEWFYKQGDQWYPVEETQSPQHPTKNNILGEG